MALREMKELDSRQNHSGMTKLWGRGLLQQPPSSGNPVQYSRAQHGKQNGAARNERTGFPTKSFGNDEAMGSWSFATPSINQKHTGKNILRYVLMWFDTCISWL